jgi:flagellar hook-basal body complex protein FliE
MSQAVQEIGATLGRIQSDADSMGQIAPAAIPEGDDGPPNDAAGFADTFKQAIHSVDDMDRAAAEKAAAVDSGKSDDLVGAMLSSQQASLSFSMLMQVRNKVMGAFDELSKLQL